MAQNSMANTTELLVSWLHHISVVPAGCLGDAMFPPSNLMGINKEWAPKTKDNTQRWRQSWRTRGTIQINTNDMFGLSNELKMKMKEKRNNTFLEMSCTNINQAVMGAGGGFFFILCPAALSFQQYQWRSWSWMHLDQHCGVRETLCC